MSQRLKWLLASLGVVLVSAFWMRWQVDSPHDQMLRLLEEVKSRTPVENLYLGDADLKKFNAKLAAAQSPVEKMTAHWERSPVLLRLGFFEESLGDLKLVEQQFRQMQASMPAEVRTQFEIELYFRLAVVCLRIGETQNCVHCQTGESCILPIQGSGIHQHQAGSQQAIGYLYELLRRDPQHLQARWLLNVAHMTLGSYPGGVPPEFLIAPDRFESDAAFPRLENVARQTGLDTFGLAGGAVVDDFDGDHLLDVIVSDWKTDVALRYFRNQGDGTFVERSQEAGLEGLFGGLNLKQADYDNDGDLDLFVLRGGWLGTQALSPNSLLENDGTGVFRDVTFSAGLGDIHHPTQTADWADYDNDGLLDLYIGNETTPSQLFRNTGRGKFVDVTSEAGVENNRYAKGVTWGDFNNDRYPDLYVSNLGGDNRLYRNNRDGTFTDIAERTGVTGPYESFPTWFWDFNNDGVLDIYVGSYDLKAGMEAFVADYIGVGTVADKDRLYQGDGDGGFQEVSSSARVQRITLPMGCNFGDVNGDGFLDYYLGTGYQDYDALQPNRLFLNRQGEYFDEVSTASGLSHIQKGHGVSIADIDNDGDQDVFIVLGGANPGDGFSNALFRNPGFGHHGITVKLVGTKSNACGMGAQIRVGVEQDGKPQIIYRWITGGSSFGANPLRQEIGLGKATRVEFVEVYWPTTDTLQRFNEVPVDRFLEIVEGSDELRVLDVPRFELPDAPDIRDDSVQVAGS